MAKHKSHESGDAALGMEANITRRDFLGSTLLASGALLLDSVTPQQLLAQQADGFTGYGGVGDYSTSNGNTLPVLQAGHKIRDAVYERLPKDIVDTGETFDCVIVGGGISGIAAALFHQRQSGPRATSLVLENHPIFGGEAKQNDFLVDGHHLIAHQGSAIYQLQQPQSFLAQFYDSVGLKTPKLTYQKWAGPQPEMPLSRTPYDEAGMDYGQYGFWFGAKFGATPGLWVMDPVRRRLEGAPISDSARTEWLRFLTDAPVEQKKFQHPKSESDPIARYLDTITLEQHYMERFGLSQETVRTFLSPVAGAGSGLGPDALSAYSDYAYEVLDPVSDEAGDMDEMFPGGNTTIARLMVKSLIPSSIDGPDTVDAVSRNTINFSALDVLGAPARIRLATTVVSVQHDGDPAKASTVSLIYEKAGKLYRVKARSVVMAGGSWTTKHIVRDLPESHRQAYAQFYRSPCMMANVAVRNWRFLYNQGLSGCRWFGGTVGDYMEVRKLALTGDVPPTIGPDSPIVLSLKCIYAYPGLPTEEQGNRGRMELLSTSFRDYERRIRQQFADMFASSAFDAQRDIAGIILNRWGHAYLSPQPGFFFGKDGQPAPREILRKAPVGRIAFANTDLAGAMDHRFSILEAQRAINQLHA
jgi:spermidine dehydrogenase